MAINNIPGVGPTNADIATAVAAPSAATIATAVAAPSAATIATQVAAAVPTRANIQSDIQTYGGGFANSYTLLSSGTLTTATTYSWSGTYKKIIMGMDIGSFSAAPIWMYVRPNADSTAANYAGMITQFSTGTTTPFQANVQGPWTSVAGVNGAIFGYNNGTSALYGQIIIEGANTTGPKFITGMCASYNALFQTVSSSGLYLGGSAITSLYYNNQNGVTSSSGRYWIIGVN